MKMQPPPDRHRRRKAGTRVVLGRLVLCLIGLTLAGQATAAEDGAALRHRYAVMNGTPEAYGFSRNPLPRIAKTLKRGGVLYREHCLTCHGVYGTGDGEQAPDLDIKPTDLSYVRMTAASVEGFVYWAIADGGEPIESPMPAFKDVLTAEEIWSLIHFMRNGFR